MSDKKILPFDLIGGNEQATSEATDATDTSNALFVTGVGSKAVVTEFECGNCNFTFPLPLEPNYCPDCGTVFKEVDKGEFVNTYLPEGYEPAEGH